MLLRAGSSALLVIDVQERLAPAIAERDSVVGNAGRLLKAARRLTVPALASEQYPHGLGPLVHELDRLVPHDARLEKTAFSCMGEPAFSDRFLSLGREQAVLLGMETHVCVLQTALDLVATGVRTYVVADACGSRTVENKRAGLERMARAGVEVVTTEMVLFEWLGRAGTDAFRDLLGLIK